MGYGILILILWVLTGMIFESHMAGVRKSLDSIRDEIARGRDK